MCVLAGQSSASTGNHQRMSLSVTVAELRKTCLNTQCAFCLGRNVVRNVTAERTALRSFLLTERCANCSLIGHCEAEVTGTVRTTCRSKLWPESVLCSHLRVCKRFHFNSTASW